MSTPTPLEGGVTPVSIRTGAVQYSSYIEGLELSYLRHPDRLCLGLSSSGEICCVARDTCSIATHRNNKALLPSDGALLFRLSARNSAQPRCLFNTCQGTGDMPDALIEVLLASSGQQLLSAFGVDAEENTKTKAVCELGLDDASVDRTVVNQCCSPPKPKMFTSPSGTSSCRLVADALLDNVADISGKLSGIRVENPEVDPAPWPADTALDLETWRNGNWDSPSPFTRSEPPDGSMPREEVGDYSSEMSDSFEGFHPVFANCNRCGNTGIITKSCDCGGTFDPPAKTGAQNVPFGAGPDFTMEEVGKIPCAGKETDESRRCTSCGCIDTFRCKEAPYACWCSGTDSIPASDDWFGIPFEIKAPLDPPPAAKLEDIYNQVEKKSGNRL